MGRSVTTPSDSMSSVCRPPVRALFWLSTALLAWTQAGYAVALAFVARRRVAPADPSPVRPEPVVSLIAAAYREERVIAEKVANALALEWPRDPLELILAVDGGAEAG